MSDDIRGAGIEERWVASSSLRLLGMLEELLVHCSELLLGCNVHCAGEGFHERAVQIHAEMRVVAPVEDASTHLGRSTDLLDVGGWVVGSSVGRRVGELFLRHRRIDVEVCQV